MKKAKIMLMAIAVIAIAGGALAFKAKTFNSFDLCTTALEGGACPNLCAAISFSSTAELEQDFPAFCYTVIATDPAPGTGEDRNNLQTCQGLNCPNKGATPSGN